MVWRLISGCHFSVIINGGTYGFFKSSRGLRQGDPLSPSLFIIGAEVLSRSLNKLLYTQNLSPFHVPHSCEPITHLAYADDVLLFTAADTRSLRLMKQTVRKYENLSGQFVNNSKSGFIVNHKAHPRLVRKIGETTGFTRKKMPITYLGVPLYQGRKVKVLFADLIQKITARIKGWSNKFLSAGGTHKFRKNFNSSSSNCGFTPLQRRYLRDRKDFIQFFMG